MTDAEALATIERAWGDETLTDGVFRIVVSSVLLGRKGATEDEIAAAKQLIQRLAANDERAGAEGD